MRFPGATVAVVLVAAALAGGGADAQSALVYDRERILAGEMWRLITCNWVHFSKSHLAYDLLAFGTAGLLIELRGNGREFRYFCLAAPALVGVGVFLTRHDLEIFGGLSGLATGSIVLLSLQGLRERTAWKWICLLAFAAIAAKTAVEFTTEQMLFAHGEMVAIKLVPESHVAGSVAALIVYALGRINARLSKMDAAAARAQA